jgi:predicted RNase H-like HicB family nuclease
MTRYIALIDGSAGAYGIVFPDLPGCTAMGTTIEQSISNAAAALHDWIEIKTEHGDPIPGPRALENLRKEPEVIEALAEGSTLVTIPYIHATGKPKKANLSLDAGILDAIDEAAEKRNLTRSAFIEFLARQFLPQIN